MLAEPGEQTALKTLQFWRRERATHKVAEHLLVHVVVTVTVSQLDYVVE